MSLFNVKYDDVQEQTTDNPPAGVYVCKIVSAENSEVKQYVKLLLDINEGAYKNHAQSIKDKFGHEGAFITSYLSYKPTLLGFFKHTATIIAESNGKLAKDLFEQINQTDGKVLKDMIVGIVVGQKEKISTNGKLYCQWCLPKLILASDARNRAEFFKVPELIKVEQNTNNKTEAIPEEEEVPF